MDAPERMQTEKRQAVFRIDEVEMPCRALNRFTQFFPLPAVRLQPYVSQVDEYIEEAENRRFRHRDLEGLHCKASRRHSTQLELPHWVFAQGRPRPNLCFVDDVVVNERGRCG